MSGGSEFVTSEGVVLNVVRHNDTTNVVTMYMRDYGAVTFLVTLSRSKRAEVRSVLFRPLALLRVTWKPRVRTGLVRPKAVEVLLPYVTLNHEPRKAAIALFMAEFLYRVLRHEQSNEGLFIFVRHALEWLDLAQEGFANFHLTFLMRLTRFLGFYPNGERYEEGAGFDLLSGNFVMARPLHAHYVEPLRAQYLPSIMRMNFDTMHVFKWSRFQRDELLTVMLEYYRLHIPGLPELNGVSVLKELF